MNDEGLADIEAANPFRLPRLHPGIGSPGGSRELGAPGPAPGAVTRVGSFIVLYQFPSEALSEACNSTVHGFVCTALARTPSGYRLYWAVYVIPVSWLTRPYLIAIEPFRRILYPAMFRRIRCAWLAAYGATA